MEAARGDAYDRIRYPGHAYSQAHPDRMAAAAILYGMNPAPVERCRVLEIGCNQGGNIIPMALGLPQSEFIGIDIAPQPIARAGRLIEQTGLRNVTAREMSLLDVDSAFGEFDYIIAHGFYSWTPEPLREKLLSVCRRNLRPDGVAYISYVTLPAGHVRQIAREAMQLQIERSGVDPEESVAQGKAFLEFLGNAASEDSLGKTILRSEFDRLKDREDQGIYHDELNASYAPVYFRDFISSAARHGLQFLSETRLRDAVNPQVKPEVLKTLGHLAGGDLIAYNQYLDLVLFREFRETLLCHQAIPLRRDILEERVTRMFVASPLRKTGEEAEGTMVFTGPRNATTIRTNNPIMVAALGRLEEIWPQGELFDDLLEMTISRTAPEARDQARHALVLASLQLASAGLADLRTYRIRVAERISERPVSSLLARLQAREGYAVTTLLHRTIRMKDELGRRFVQLLDGTRNLEDVVNTLAADYPEAPRESIAEQVRGNVGDLYRMGLLAG